MGTRVVGMILVVAVLQLIGARDGFSARVLTATETTGLPVGDLTSATDSGLPPPGNVCATANENANACFGTPYNVPSTLINPNFVANGGAMGVNLCDVLGPTCLLGGTDPNNTISDQLYLKVGPQNAVAGTNSVTWCWDSDLEPNVNICQNTSLGGIQVPSSELSTVLEPPDNIGGFTDLTSIFTDANTGLLAAGAWQVRALSEAPEPASMALLGVGLAGLGLLRRKRR